jgi:hypothetical protein
LENSLELLIDHYCMAKCVSGDAEEQNGYDKKSYLPIHGHPPEKRTAEWPLSNVEGRFVE